MKNKLFEFWLLAWQEFLISENTGMALKSSHATVSVWCQDSSPAHCNSVMSVAFHLENNCVFCKKDSHYSYWSSIMMVYMCSIFNIRKNGKTCKCLMECYVSDVDLGYTVVWRYIIWFLLYYKWNIPPLWMFIKLQCYQLFKRWIQITVIWSWPGFNDNSQDI